MEAWFVVVVVVVVVVWVAGLVWVDWGELGLEARGQLVMFCSNNG